MKRFLCAVAAMALLFVLAACGRGLLAAPAEAAPTSTPTSSTSRNVRSEPVAVTETYANTDTVPGSTAAASESNTAQAAETPATGDFPVTYFAGVIGLILVCSAGLLLLKRI